MDQQQKNVALKSAQIGALDTLREVFKTNHTVHWTDIFYQKTGDTILHIAARRGHKIIIEYLLTNFTPKSVDCKNNDDKTALHEAAQFSQFECCELLLKHGANIDAIKRADWSPLMLACTKSGQDSLKTVEVLLKYNPVINYKNKDGWTALHLACREGDVHILNLLIENGIDVKIKTKNGRSCLHIAALHGHVDILKRLLPLGVDIEDIDSCGNTPLHEAVLSKNLAVCTLLVRHGANIYCKNNDGFTVLHLAASEGNMDALNYFVNEMQFNVNETNNNGCTALHCAARTKQVDVCEFLSKCGLDFNAKDKFGRTASEYLGKNILSLQNKESANC